MSWKNRVQVQFDSQQQNNLEMTHPWHQVQEPIWTVFERRRTMQITFQKQFLWKAKTNYANYFSKAQTNHATFFSTAISLKSNDKLCKLLFKKVSLERKDKLCKILFKSNILKSKDKLCKLLFKQNIFRKAKTNYAKYFSWPLTLFKEFSNFYQEVKGSKYRN